MRIATEVELKLVAPASALPQVQQALLELAPGASCSRSSLKTTYYDTADRALSRRKLALRVREADGRFVQTVKADGAAGDGLLARGEWEDEIAGSRPDPQAPNSGARLPQGIAADLQPLFATAVTRTKIMLEPSPALCIEAAIDEGEIRGIAAATTTPISEVELELKRGDPAALFDTALDLLASAPLRIETRSKAERGFAALAGEPAPPRPITASAPTLDPAMPAAAALKRIGRTCLAHLLNNEAAALAGDAEGVHQMRLALRRLRAAVATFAPMLPKPERLQLRAELDGLDAVLGPARNVDVVAEDLVAPVRKALPDEPGLDRLAAALEAARRAAHRDLRVLILSPRYTASTLALLRWFESRQAEAGSTLATPIGEAAPVLLDRCRRRARRRAKGFRRASERDRHRLRIALKQLRYAGEFFGGLFEPRRVKRFTKRLKKLQDALGYANDVRVGGDILAGLQKQAGDDEEVAEAGNRVIASHRRVLDREERKLRRRVKRLRRAAPFWSGGVAPYSAAVSSPDGQATPVPPSPQ